MLDGKTKTLEVGDCLHIPKDKPHRLINLGEEDLEVIEVALGVCDEDDIVRLEDKYGR